MAPIYEMNPLALRRMEEDRLSALGAAPSGRIRATRGLVALRALTLVALAAL